MTEISKYFYRVSNDWIRCRPPNIKRICVYYLIDYVRNLSDEGVLSLKYITEKCGYKCRKGVEGVSNVYKSLFAEAIEQGDIVLDKGYVFPPHTFTEAISYTINPDKFDIATNFTKLTDTEFNTLIRNSANRNKESMLGVYLYIKSYYHIGTSLNRPIGFYQSLDSMQEAMGYTRKTLICLLNELVEQNMLHKHYTGSREFIRNGNKIRENVPNIYIPNLNQSQDEIEDITISTVKLMKEYYKVSKFLPFMKNLKEN